LTAAVHFARIEQVFLQQSIFGSGAPRFDEPLSSTERVELSERSWIDVAPGWLSGADVLYSDLLEVLPLRQRRNVAMYDALVDEPRMTAWWHHDDGSPEPVPVLAAMRRSLIERYDVPFDSIGFNLYRDHRDSVAWHGDRHRRRVTDPVVAIVSVGARRPLRMRPAGGGASRSWNLGDGDLFVMGGACQHEWQHCVPKLGRPTGPRLSITFRHDTR
jgi:alkylated DNA repair dioxygenase AlkB